MFNSYEIKQMRNQAEKDLIVKLRLERTFKPELRSLFSRMTKDFRTTVAITGMAPKASDYSSSWKDLLKKHYNRTQQAFLGSVEGQLKQLEPAQADLLGLALLDYRNVRADIQENFITKTTDNNMFRAIQEARQALEEDEQYITNRSLATTAAIILTRKQKGRIEGISTLETQAPAESTKLFEARSLSGASPSPAVTPTEQVFRPVVSELIKTWKTVGDRTVRNSHKAANNQTVGIDDNFIVQGQSLSYPGDNFMGATIDNTAG